MTEHVLKPLVRGEDNERPPFSGEPPSTTREQTEQMTWFEKFHFSLTCRTDDFAVLHCLRALSEWANDKVPYPHKMIAWGHTKEIDWKKAGHKAIFRFVDTGSREKFIIKANELLQNRWAQTGTSDADPATPTRQR